MSEKTFDITADSDNPFSGVFDGLDASEQHLVNAIASKVNQRVMDSAGPQPVVPFWKAYGVYFGGIALLAISFAVWHYWPSNTSVDASTQIAATSTSGVGADQLPDASSSTESSSAVLLASDNDPNSPAIVPAVNRTEDLQPENVISPLDAVIPADSDSVNGGNVVDSNSDQLITDPVVLPNGTEEKTAQTGGTSDGDNTDPSAPSLAVVNVKVLFKSTYSGDSGGGGGTRNGEISGPSRTNRGNAMLPNEMPSYNGGDVALQNYVKAQISDAIRSNPEVFGETILVKFLVNHKGKISDVEGENGADFIKKEAERIVREMPNWKPGLKKGKIVCRIAITFG